MGDARLPVLGRRQRLVMGSIFDHGFWARGCDWYVGTPKDTERICRALVARGLLTATVPHASPVRYVLTGAGWSWLIVYAALDLRGIGCGSRAWNQVTNRLGNLTTIAQLSAGGTVNRKGDRV